jgi:hypothetical protein
MQPRFGINGILDGTPPSLAHLLLPGAVQVLLPHGGRPSLRPPISTEARVLVPQCDKKRAETGRMHASQKDTGQRLKQGALTCGRGILG